MHVNISNTNSPKISIVTVVFNDVQHVERTILSVLNQTYPNIEYIIIDGGSTDGTVEIIKKYANRLGFWVSEKDKGIYDAMNKGIERATGEWINFMNSGDYFFSDTILEKIFHNSHRTADLLYGSFIGNFSGRSVKCVAYENVRDRAWQAMQLCHQTLFSRTSIMKKYPFNTRFKVSADGDFVTRCIASGYVFERIDEIIFRVGTLGYSNANWLTARLENWKIARTYFNSWCTNMYHAKNLLKDVVFHMFKFVTSTIGLYQLVRWVYRKKIKSTLPLLPPGCSPFED